MTQGAAQQAEKVEQSNPGREAVTRIARRCNDCKAAHWCAEMFSQCTCPGCGSDQIETLWAGGRRGAVAADAPICLHCRRSFVQAGFKTYAPATTCSLACADSEGVVGETFAQRMKRLRVAKHLTQQDLGDLLGATNTAVSLWERGKRSPSAQTLAVLANIYGMSMDRLWFGPRSNRAGTRDGQGRGEATG